MMMTKTQQQLVWTPLSDLLSEPTINVIKRSVAPGYDETWTFVALQTHLFDPYHQVVPLSSCLARIIKCLRKRDDSKKLAMCLQTCVSDVRQTIEPQLLADCLNIGVCVLSIQEKTNNKIVCLCCKPKTDVRIWIYFWRTRTNRYLLLACCPNVLESSVCPPTILIPTEINLVYK
jgi:hypothetical protein